MSHPIYKYCPYCAAPLQSRFLYNRDRPVCSQCGFIYFEDPKVAAGALVVKDDRVLLVRRIMEPSSGKWTFPGGFMDAHEEPIAAAKREVLEETGLDIEITNLLEVISGREHPLGADLVLVYSGTIRGGSLKADDDVDRAEFFALDNLPPLAFRATQIALSKLKAGMI